MQEAVGSPIPPSIDRVLRLFRSMGREEKMQALVQYSKKLEPFPERFSELDRTKFNIPECQTRVDIVPELNVRQSPTIAAVLTIVFGAVNDQPPETTLGIPTDFVRTMMESIGLGVREPGLTAMILRLKRYALE